MSAEEDDISLIFRIAACPKEKTSSPGSVREDAAAAISELYDRYVRLVFSLANQIVRDEAIAEEITQDVFLQVWNKAATFQPKNGRVISWLASVTRYRAIDVLRRQNARPEGHHVPIEDDLALGDDPDDWVELAVDTYLDRQKVHQALLGLPVDQRKALILAFFEGLTQEEISKTLDEPLGTIKTRIRLAMQKLRQSLADNNGTH